MRLPAVLLVCLLLGGCISMEPTQVKTGLAPEEHPGSPCSDSLYVALQEKPIEQLSTSEYAYFRRQDTACREWKAENSYRGKVREPTTPLTRNLIVGGFTAGLAVIGYFVIRDGN